MYTGLVLDKRNCGAVQKKVVNGHFPSRRLFIMRYCGACRQLADLTNGLCATMTGPSGGRRTRITIPMIGISAGMPEKYFVALPDILPNRMATL